MPVPLGHHTCFPEKLHQYNIFQTVSMYGSLYLFVRNKVYCYRQLFWVWACARRSPKEAIRLPIALLKSLPKNITDTSSFTNIFKWVSTDGTVVDKPGFKRLFEGAGFNQSVILWANRCTFIGVGQFICTHNLFSNFFKVFPC